MEVDPTLLAKSSLTRTTRISTPETNGQTRLMGAVLREAMKCFEQLHRSDQPRDQQAFAEVSAWFASDACEYVFAFETICQHLGIRPESVRAHLRAITREGGLTRSVPLAEAKALS